MCSQVFLTSTTGKISLYYNLRQYWGRPVAKNWKTSKYWSTGCPLGLLNYSSTSKLCKLGLRRHALGFPLPRGMCASGFFGDSINLLFTHILRYRMALLVFRKTKWPPGALSSNMNLTKRTSTNTRPCIQLLANGC